MCRSTILFHPELTVKIATPVHYYYSLSLHCCSTSGLGVWQWATSVKTRTCPNRVFFFFFFPSLHLLSIQCDFNPGQVSLICFHGYIIFLPLWHLRSLAHTQAHIDRTGQENTVYTETILSFKTFRKADSVVELLEWHVVFTEMHVTQSRRGAAY